MMAQTRKRLAECSLILITTKPATYFSGFTTMLAAMAMGRAVVFDNPENGEVYGLKDGENAIYIPCGKVGEAAGILQHWLADPSGLARLA